MNDKERFDKFTERARKVLSLAQEEAQRFNHNYIGTEHLLLGLVREGDGVAAKVLSNLGVELNKVRSAVEFIIGRGDRIVLGEIGLTPRAKKVIELAVDEARRLNHHYIGTEHLLLGLVREGQGIAAGVLESFGVNLEKARAETFRMLSMWKLSDHVVINDPSSVAKYLEDAVIALEGIHNEKEAAIRRKNFELAAELSGREVALRDRIAKLEADWFREQADKQNTASKEDNISVEVAPVSPIVTGQTVEAAVASPTQAPTVPSPSVRNGAFISYSHRDKEYLERLRVHLRYFERAGALNIWDDTRIIVGSKWREEIKRAIGSARVAILLISADFLASDFIAENELPPLLAAAQEEGAVIIPTILKHCAFEDSELSQFQAVEQAQPLIDF